MIERCRTNLRLKREEWTQLSYLFVDWIYLNYSIMHVQSQRHTSWFVLGFFYIQWFEVRLEHYTFMALVVGRYEGLFTRRSHFSRGLAGITFYSICVVVYVGGCHMAARGSGIHDIYFPGACGLGIHEVLSCWYVTFFS